MAGKSPGVDDTARIFLRPIGTPLALGLFAVTVQSTMLAAMELGWISPQEGTTVAITGLAFAFPLQLIASVLAFLARDAVAGTALAIFAGTWAVSGLAMLTSPPGATSDAVGICLILAAILLGCVMVTGAVAARKLIVGLVLAFGSTRLVVTALFEIKESSGLETAAGILGLWLAAVALYAGLALLLEDAGRKTLLPTLRGGAAREAVTDGLPGQVSDVANEAGVRQQL